MPLPTFSLLPEDRYFEDYVAGAVYEFGSVEMTEPEIVAFASRYDAQSFHIDPERARQSVFDSIIASGWHTGSVMMSMLVDHFLSRAASMGSPGVEAIRWPRPVRPGDVLRARVTVLDARLSRSKPDRGIVAYQVEVLNQRDEVAMEMRATNFVGVRAAGKRQ